MFKQLIQTYKDPQLEKCRQTLAASVRAFVKRSFCPNMGALWIENLRLVNMEINDRKKVKA